MRSCPNLETVFRIKVLKKRAVRHHNHKARRTLSQSCRLVAIPFTNCQMHWYRLLLSIRSLNLKIMKNKLLLHVLPVVFYTTWIEQTKDDKEAIYLSLFQNTTLKGNLLPKHDNTKFPREIPFDYFCPSTKDTLIKCVWTHCSLYLRSIKSKQNRSQNCKSKSSAKNKW